ncbi:ABC transporter ATP-binding protein [Bacillus tianshenii]|nr:ABC transporter ATP-binding protein [Bacillus tianshenii]
MIEIKNLTKKYGSFTALKGLNLSIKQGIVFGFVGPNGAGKSTTFSILATLLAPTSGEAYVDGVSVIDNPKEIRSKIGYMPDFFGVYDQFKVHEYLDFYGASYRIGKQERQQLMTQLLDLVDLSDKRDTYVDSLSRGMKQRLCLARSLIHDPQVLILDEPASGLDPRARIEMREIIKELKSMDKTILISSHILPELAEMCDEIGVIENGELAVHGSVREIQQALQADKILIVTLHAKVEEAIRFFEDNPHVSNLVRDNVEPNTIHFGFAGTDEEQVKLLGEAIQTGLPILNFQQRITDLEDVFLEITKGGV